MTRFAALRYAITAAAAAIGTTAFQPPHSLLLPTLRHHEALVRFSSPHDSITPHNNHNDGHYQLEQKTWMFHDKYPIAYEVASDVTTDRDEDFITVPILLLNGFGVGSFHQHRLMRQLLIEQQNQQSKKRYVIYGIDYLGQGKSWPKDPQDGNSADEYQLGYSADMWLDQLASFVQEVVISPATDNDDSTTTATTTSNSINNNKKVHLVGNSVGGYLATILTHKHPQLISSLTLLNATPVWGLNLPGWDGKLPAPAVPKAIARQMFNLIRNEDVIRQYLEAAYVRGEAFDGSFEDGFDGWGCIASNADNENGAATAGRGLPLGAKIRACTEGNGGHAAFASILWSAPASGISFYEALQQVPVDVLLLFGGDDPWCTEAVGKRMHVTLASRRDGEACRFVTLKNVGHCPNHEAPTAVAQVLMPWLDADDSEERRVVPLDSVSQIQEPWGEVVIREVSIEESESLGLVDRVVSSMVG